MRRVKSKYARVFDSSCKDWNKDREFNVMYLKVQQNYFNDVLKTRGYVFLRDVYEYLGFPITKTSLFVGWYCDSTNADNYIDFGIHVTEDENKIELDFNVDGDITCLFED